MEIPWYNSRHTLISRKRDGKPRMIGGQIVVVRVAGVHHLKRLQHVIGVDGAATHSQKDGVESNGGSLKGGAEAFMLFLCGAQLVLRSSVLTVPDLNEVNVTLKTAEIFDSMLSGEGGSANGWRCC